MLTQFYFDGNAPGMYAYVNGPRKEVDHLGSTCTNCAVNFEVGLLFAECISMRH